MKSKNRWTFNNKSVANVNYHLIWCPKYRRKVLTGSIEVRLKELLLEKSKELGIEIKTMEVMPDHVHLFINSNPTLSIHFIVQQLKGYTSRILRKEFKELTSRLPSLWTRSYYVETVGSLSDDTIIRYIENQKNV